MIDHARQGGMTLIELMVAVSIVALLAMLAAPSFVSTLQNRRIRTAAESVLVGLQYAKTEAVRRNRAVNFSLASDGSWQVGCATEDTTLANGEQACPAQLQSHPATGSTRAAIITATQAANITDVGSTGTGLVQFTPLGRANPSTVPAGSLAVYTVTNPMSGTCATDGGDMRCMKVFVTSLGQVRMCDPAAGSADPRACH